MIQFIYSLDIISSAANQVIDSCMKSKIICFEGDLGAGKTTLVEEICRTLGSRDELSSPTYSILNEYSSEGGSILHADLYRLKSLEEALDLGIEDYLYSGHYCLIEWHQIAESILPRPYYVVHLRTISERERELLLELIE